jgi:hypothetical protein
MRHVDENGHVWFAIHEVFYDVKNRVEAWGEPPEAPFGQTVEELRSNWAQMKDAFRLPVLEYGAAVRKRARPRAKTATRKTGEPVARTGGKGRRPSPTARAAPKSRSR